MLQSYCALQCKKNYVKNGVLGHLCAHNYRLNKTGPREPPQDVVMTLASRRRIQNSSPVGLRSSTLPLDHGGFPQYWIFTSERGINFFFFETWGPEWGSNLRSPTLQAGSTFPCRSEPPDNIYDKGGWMCQLFLSNIGSTSASDYFCIRTFYKILKYYVMVCLNVH